MTDNAQPTIFLPTPEGHRRGSLRFMNGLIVPMACSPEELAELVDDFQADPAQRQLELRDAEYNEPYWLLRPTVDEGHLMAIAVQWVTNPAPEIGQRGGVTIARDMPPDPLVLAEARRAERRRRRGLS